MAIYSGFFHEKWWFSIVMLVYQRVFGHIWTRYRDPTTSQVLQVLIFAVKPREKRTTVQPSSTADWGEGVPGSGRCSTVNWSTSYVYCKFRTYVTKCWMLLICDMNDPIGWLSPLASSTTARSKISGTPTGLVSAKIYFMLFHVVLHVWANNCFRPRIHMLDDSHIGPWHAIQVFGTFCHDVSQWESPVPNQLLMAAAVYWACSA